MKRLKLAIGLLCKTLRFHSIVAAFFLAVVAAVTALVVAQSPPIIDEPPLPQCLRLYIEPRGRNEYVVSLMTCDGTPATAPADIKVKLEVTSGEAHCDPSFLMIKKGEGSSTSNTVLKAKPGWHGEIAALVVSPNEIGIGSGYLEPNVVITVKGIELSASWNWAPVGSPIYLEARLFTEENGLKVYVTPEQLGVEAVIVYFNTNNGQVVFEGELPQIVISKYQYVGVKKISSFAQVNDLRIKAYAFSPSGEKLDTELCCVSLGFPWLLLGLAILGGVTLPIVRIILGCSTLSVFRKEKLGLRLQRMIIGALLAIALYISSLFSAVVVGKFSLWGVTVDMTRLPSNNPLAAWLVGLMSSLPVNLDLIKVMFVEINASKKTKQSARKAYGYIQRVLAQIINIFKT